MDAYFDSEEYVAWRRRRGARRKRIAYVVIVVSLIALAILTIIGK